MTYGNEERMELGGFLWRCITAQRHPELLAAVCRKLKKNHICLRVLEIKTVKEAVTDREGKIRS